MHLHLSGKYDRQAGFRRMAAVKKKVLVCISIACMLMLGLMGWRMKNIELMFEDGIDLGGANGVTSMRRCSASYVSFDMDAALAELLGEGAAFKEEWGNGAVYSAGGGEGERLLVVDDVGLCGQKGIGFNYLDTDAEIGNELELFYNEHWGTAENDELMARCLERELDFMSREDASRLVLDRLSALGQQNVEVTALFGVGMDDLIEQYGDREGLEEYYEINLRQTVDGIPVNGKSYANRSGHLCDMDGPYIVARVTANGLVQMSCSHMLVPTPLGEPERIISFYEACNILSDSYAGSIVGSAELIYHEVMTGDDARVELVPTWAFGLKSYGAAQGSSDYRYEYCLMDAITGEIYEHLHRYEGAGIQEDV